MSSDKHKKKARAFAFLARAFGRPDRIERTFSGRPTAEMLWLIQHGMGKIVRRRKDAATNRRNVFIEK